MKRPEGVDHLAHLLCYVILAVAFLYAAGKISRELLLSDGARWAIVWLCTSMSIVLLVMSAFCLMTGCTLSRLPAVTGAVGYLLVVALSGGVMAMNVWNELSTWVGTAEKEGVGWAFEHLFDVAGMAEWIGLIVLMGLLPQAAKAGAWSLRRRDARAEARARADRKPDADKEKA